MFNSSLSILRDFWGILPSIAPHSAPSSQQKAFLMCLFCSRSEGLITPPSACHVVEAQNCLPGGGMLFASSCHPPDSASPGVPTVHGAKEDTGTQQPPAETP